MSHDRSIGGYTYPRVLLTFVFAGLLLLACAPVSQAQSNAEYTFRQQSVIDGDSYAGSPAPVLTMDALAANGYGQWTLSSYSGSYNPGWFLLANGLYKPSTKYDAGDTVDYPSAIPPGVVATGSLDYTPTEPKAMANLDGAVYYVWPDPTDRKSFIVENSISSFSVPTWTGTSTNTHDISSDEIDFRDNCDEACDAGFLYIVWSSSVNPDTASQKEIWATVIDLATHETVDGYPMLMGTGIRPTISCDPRWNSPISIFYVSFLTGLSVGDVIMLTAYVGTYQYYLWPMPSEYLVPNTLTWATYSFGFATHARVVASGMQLDQDIESVVVYAIASGHLLCYDDALFAAAYYVDGPLTPWTLPTLDGEQPEAPPTVVDNPIIAFADPYSSYQSWLGYYYPDPFHCLYQLDATYPDGERFPLVIVRGADNATTNAPDASSIGDTRLVLNQDTSRVLQNDPLPNTYLDSTDGGWYVGAANQMGIHVHWRALDGSGDTTHFYARDTSRTFDEPIDENTLVTDICTISDGTAHGGTAGAMVLPGKQMTIWTDPNYGVSTGCVTCSLYQPHDIHSIDSHAGMLNFKGDSVKLTIGNGSAPATLSVMPLFYFNFFGSGQGVTIDSGSTFDYYGINATRKSSDLSVALVATPFTDGTGDGLGAGTIDLEGGFAPAYLNIHGGAYFYIGPNGTFISHSSIVNIYNEPDLYPIGTSNRNASGASTILKTATISNSNVIWHP